MTRKLLSLRSHILNEGVAATPAADSLLRIDEEADRLSKAESEKLHRAVAQLLYLATRARPGILLGAHMTP